MLRVLRAFLFDGVSWLLFMSFLILVFVGVTHLFNRHDELDIVISNLTQLERDITWLHHQKDEKQEWITRLETDPTAWEMIAREKMNYLGQDQVLIKFNSGIDPDFKE